MDIDSEDEQDAEGYDSDNASFASVDDLDGKPYLSTLLPCD